MANKKAPSPYLRGAALKIDGEANTSALQFSGLFRVVASSNKSPLISANLINISKIHNNFLLPSYKR